MIGPDGTLVSYNAFSAHPASRLPGSIAGEPNANDTMFLAYRVTIVPEPSTLLALASGTGILLGFRRRRHMA
jgi:hypothetical protein